MEQLRIYIYALINNNSFLKSFNNYFWVIYMIDFFTMIIITNIYLGFP